MTKITKPAITPARLHPLVADRFSPRIYDSSQKLTEEQLASIAEAFRWAPSSMNLQPWQLVLATRGSELFDKISSAGLTGFNQRWAPNSSAYAVVLAEKPADGAREKAEIFFDVGLASQQMVIQAEALGLKSHYMGGIVHEAIADIVAADDHWVVCVIAIGYQGDLEGNEQAIIEREESERERKAPADVYRLDEALS